MMMMMMMMMMMVMMMMMMVMMMMMMIMMMMMVMVTCRGACVRACVLNRFHRPHVQDLECGDRPGVPSPICHTEPARQYRY
jgi:hypothetical protein